MKLAVVVFCALAAYAERSVKKLQGGVRSQVPRNVGGNDDGRVANSDLSNLLMVTTLDGRVSAFDTLSGRKMWSTSTGGALVRASHPTTRGRRPQPLDDASGVDEGPADQRLPPDPLVVPGRDGSILLASPGGGLQQLPYKAQDLVNQLPITSGPVLVVGSKTSKAMRLSLRTGRVLRTVSATMPLQGDDEPLDDDAFPGGSRGGEEEEGDDERGPSVWVGRSDYVVTAFNGAGTRVLWNVSYSELLPPEAAGGLAGGLHVDPSGAVAVVVAGAGGRGGQAPPSTLLPSLTSSVRGDIVASHAGTGALQWRSEALGAPVVHAHVLHLTHAAAAGASSAASFHRPPPGISSVQRVEVGEVWPSVAAGPGSWKQRQLPTTVTGASRARGALAGDVPAFVGVLPTGQVYALQPLGPHVAWEDVDLEEDDDGGDGNHLGMSGPRDSGADGDPREGGWFSDLPLALPAPVPEAASTAVVVTASGGVIRADSALLPRIIGIHNVTLWGAIGAGNKSQQQAAHEADVAMPSLPQLPPVKPVSQPLSSWRVVVLSFALLATGAGLAVSVVILRRKGRRRSLEEELREESERRTQEAIAAATAALATVDDSTSSSGSLTPAAAVAPAGPVFTMIGGVRHRTVGRLAVSDAPLGYGSHGTVVYAGQWDGRRVAVKRMLKAFHGPSAAREISLLIRSDGHRNVVRYFACEEDGGGDEGPGGDFLYLALEKCACSLAQAVERLGRHSGAAARTDAPAIVAGAKRGSNAKALSDKQLSQLPAPSPAMRGFLRQIVEGVAHLHAHRILHRDLKPHNILLAETVAAAAGEAQAQASSGGEGRASAASGAGLDSVPAHMARLYPGDSPEHRRLAAYVPKISDFGLGKQLPGAGPDGALTGGNPLALAASALGGGSSSSALLGRLAPGLRNLLFGSSMSSASSSSSAVTPGSTGWTAPEVVSAAVQRHKAGGAGGGALEEVAEDGASTGTTDAEGEDSNGIDATAGPAASSESDPAPSPFSFASDVWSLGAVLYHVLDPGRHPFGEPWEREANLLRRRGQPDLSRVAHLPEAHDLLSRMLHPDPARRPSAAEAADHPFFWPDERRLALLCDLSDRLEQEPYSAGQHSSSGPATGLGPAIEATGEEVVGVRPCAWADRLPSQLFGVDSTAGGTPKTVRRYDFRSVGDLMRLLRNKRSHFREMSRALVGEMMGSPDAPPTALLPYFTAPHRFPRLTMVGYRVACEWLAHEPHFAPLLGAANAATHAAASALRVAKARASQPQPLPSHAGARGAASAPIASPLSSPKAAGTAGTQSAASGVAASLEKSPSSGPRSQPQQSAGLGADSRAWFLSRDQWLPHATSVAVRAVTHTGGPVIPSTVDLDGGVAASSPHLGVQGPRGLPQPMVMVVCAHDRGARETAFKGGAHVSSRNYKTAPCKDWDASGGVACPRGVRCDFSHGAIERRLASGAGSKAGSGATEASVSADDAVALAAIGAMIDAPTAATARLRRW